MIHAAFGYLEGFWTWQTPVSFLAGVGAAQLIRRFMPDITIGDEEDDVQEGR